MIQDIKLFQMKVKNQTQQESFSNNIKQIEYDE